MEPDQSRGILQNIKLKDKYVLRYKRRVKETRHACDPMEINWVLEPALEN